VALCVDFILLFLFRAFNFRGALCAYDNAGQSRQSMRRNGRGGGEAKVVILLCQAVFPWETVRGGVPCTAPPTQYWP